MNNKVMLTVGGEKSISAPTTDTILKTLHEEGILLEAVCGGRGTCGKCKIKVLTGNVLDKDGQPLQPESDGSYRACQAYPATDIVLEVLSKAGFSSKGEIGRISLSGRQRMATVKKYVIEPVYPTMQQKFSLQDMININPDLQIDDFHALSRLAEVTRNKPRKLTLVSIDGVITSVEEGDTSTKLYGVAFDIGTTTIAAMLIDVNQGVVIRAMAEMNPQVAFGADVITRINAATTPEGLNKLSTILREGLNSLLEKLVAGVGFTKESLYLVMIAGNSTMEHLLLGISPESLSKSPYAQVFKQLPPLKTSELPLLINPGGRTILLPNLTSFVGADTTSGIMAVNMDQTAKLTLLIDLGTNGEIAIGNQTSLVVSSTAAGPAFEGAQLSCGMRAMQGAIEGVFINEGVSVETIGKKYKPIGICGSGVIKALAEMVREGLLMPSGRFADNERLTQLSVNLSERVRINEAGQKEFVVVYAKDSGHGADIVLTQSDIREIQLVKSSICTGTEILMEELGITETEIEQVLIAGAFGNYINLDSAIEIGLIPISKRSKLRAVGNAAGEGAAKALLSEAHWRRCQEIAKRTGFVELASHPRFQEKFIKNLEFPTNQHNR